MIPHATGAQPDSRARYSNVSTPPCPNVRLSRPSVMRWPPPSMSMTSGRPRRRASSVVPACFWMPRFPSEPPTTVKSVATTAAGRPSISAVPVSIPSPGESASVTWSSACANVPYSWKLPGSHRAAIRSRGVSRPRSCARVTAAGRPASLTMCRSLATTSVSAAAAWSAGTSSGSATVPAPFPGPGAGHGDEAASVADDFLPAGADAEAAHHDPVDDAFVAAELIGDLIRRAGEHEPVQHVVAHQRRRRFPALGAQAGPQLGRQVGEALVRECALVGRGTPVERQRPARLLARDVPVVVHRGKDGRGQHPVADDRPDHRLDVAGRRDRVPEDAVEALCGERHHLRSDRGQVDLERRQLGLGGAEEPELGDVVVLPGEGLDLLAPD